MTATFGVIGYGRFGKLWAKALSAFGNVLVYDRNSKIKTVGKNIQKTGLSQAAKADFVFLLVPISEIENCCRQIKSHLLPGAVVVDACSVKMYPAGAMKSALKKNQPIIATHPLFGPDSAQRNKGLKNLKIMVSNISAKKQSLQKLTGIFHKMGLTVIAATPKEHDQSMATSQSLVHFIGRGLEALRLKSQKLSTPDYQALVNINDMVVNDTMQLFFDMHNYNSFSKKVRQRLHRGLLEVEKQILVREKDLLKLRQDIEWVDSFIIQALSVRLALSSKIGEVKKSNGLGILDVEREKKLAKIQKQAGLRWRLNPKFVSALFTLILKESKFVQNR